MATQNNILIYGCYGYTGRLAVSEALAKGLRPVVAGRDQAKTQAVSEQTGLEARVFNVEDAATHLDDIDVFLHCAGPFAITAEPVMQACMATGTHYLDITGEIPVFQLAQSLDAAAKKAGIVLCPGVGFDIVPTDVLAARLVEALPGATDLELAFDFGSLPSQGTTKTAVKGIPNGGLIRKNGELTTVSLGYQIRKIPFPRGTQSAVSFPWGDVFTAHYSTGVQNTIVYYAMPAVLCWSMKVVNAVRGLLATKLMQKVLTGLVGFALPDGPSDKTRETAGTQYWGKVCSTDGRSVDGTLTAPSVYALTAECAVASAMRLAAPPESGGYYTASRLLGSDFLNDRPGYQMVINSAGGGCSNKFEPTRT